MRRRVDTERNADERREADGREREISVYGMTSRMSEVTGRPEMTSTPRLPTATLEKKRHSRTGIGWSSPISAMKRRESSGVACGPKSVVAGSPGTSDDSVNRSSIAPITISTVVTRRLPR
jgi:hypothetical protein